MAAAGMGFSSAAGPPARGQRPPGTIPGVDSRRRRGEMTLEEFLARAWGPPAMETGPVTAPQELEQTATEETPEKKTSRPTRQAEEDAGGVDYAPRRKLRRTRSL